MGVGQSLRRHWSSRDVEINSGVSEEELNSFAAKYSVVMPEDLRDYFLVVNGMADGVVDDGMIRFWTLEEMKPLPDGAPAYSDENYVENPSSLFLFADYSIWAHPYAIRLGSVALPSNEVVIIGYEKPITVSKSFLEFVDSYLTNKDLLH